jgi:uncharacterized protein YpmS
VDSPAYRLSFIIIIIIIVILIIIIMIMIIIIIIPHPLTRHAHSYGEAQYSQFKSEHATMVTLIEAELQRQARDIDLLRSLLLDGGLEGWMEKQGGG